MKIDAPANAIRHSAPWMVALAICAVYLLTVFLANETDPLVFIEIGTRYADSDPTGTEGYDGQFAYYIAAHPFTAPAQIDVPAYRYQRILLPVLGRILALGQPALVPWAFLAINLAALAKGTHYLEKLLAAHKVSRWYALVYGLFGGVLMAVRLSLNEPLAYALVLAAIWYGLRKQILLTGILFALAALAKETTLLFTAGYGLWLLVSQRSFRDALVFGMTALLPFALWQGVLAAVFGKPGIGSGGAMATPFEIIPFNGLWRIYTETGQLQVFIALAALLVPAVVLPSVWALWRVWQALRRQPLGEQHLFIYLLLFNAGIMPFVPFSTFREPLGMMRFMIGLIISIVLYGALKRDQRILRYSTLWLLSLMLLITSG